MNKKTSSKDRGILNMPEDQEMWNNDREGQKSKKGSKSIYLGYDYFTEFGQPKNFFFTREKSVMPIQGHYKGASAFLCLSGPSFKNVLDEYENELRQVFTMSVNNSIKSFRTDSWLSVDDPSRFLTTCFNDPRIMKFVPMGHSEKKIWDTVNNIESNIKVGECPNMLYFTRNNKFNESRWMTEAGFNWGNHQDFGGGRTVMLVAIKILYVLGFRKIYLLGCDLKMNANYKYHFEEERTKGAINCNNGTYKRLMEEYLPKLKPYFDKYGLEIYNCNPESNLKVFPFIDAGKAFEQALDEVGDYESENTLGMYKDPKKKKQESKARIKAIRQDQANEEFSKTLKQNDKKEPTIVKVTKNKNNKNIFKHFSDGNKEKISLEAYKEYIDKGVPNV